MTVANNAQTINIVNAPMYFCCFLRRMRLKERILVLLIGVTCCLVCTFLVLTTNSQINNDLTNNNNDDQLISPAAAVSNYDVGGGDPDLSRY